MSTPVQSTERARRNGRKRVLCIDSGGGGSRRGFATWRFPVEKTQCGRFERKNLYLRAEKPMHKTRSVPLRAGLAEPPPVGTRDPANIGSRQSWFNGEGRGLARGAAPSRCGPSSCLARGRSGLIFSRVRPHALWPRSPVASRLRPSRPYPSHLLPSRI